MKKYFFLSTLFLVGVPAISYASYTAAGFGTTAVNGSYADLGDQSTFSGCITTGTCASGTHVFSNGSYYMEALNTGNSAIFDGAGRYGIDNAYYYITRHDFAGSWNVADVGASPAGTMTYYTPTPPPDVVTGTLTSVIQTASSTVFSSLGMNKDDVALFMAQLTTVVIATAMGILQTLIPYIIGIVIIIGCIIIVKGAFRLFRH